MAIACTAYTWTMTDAEFLKVNGVAAPTIPKASPLYDIGATATASAGTTTLILPSGTRYAYNIDRLADILRRAAASNQITYTP